MIQDSLLNKLKGKIIKKIDEKSDYINIHFKDKNGDDEGFLHIKVKNKDISYKYKEKK